MDWDTRDGEGRPVAAGIYLLRLSAAERALTRKLVVTKYPRVGLQEGDPMWFEGGR